MPRARACPPVSDTLLFLGGKSAAEHLELTLQSSQVIESLQDDHELFMTSLHLQPDSAGMADTRWAWFDHSLQDKSAKQTPSQTLNSLGDFNTRLTKNLTVERKKLGETRNGSEIDSEGSQWTEDELMRVEKYWEHEYSLLEAIALADEENLLQAPPGFNAPPSEADKIGRKTRLLETEGERYARIHHTALASKKRGLFPGESQWGVLMRTKSMDPAFPRQQLDDVGQNMVDDQQYNFRRSWEYEEGFDDFKIIQGGNQGGVEFVAEVLSFWGPDELWSHC